MHCIQHDFYHIVVSLLPLLRWLLRWLTQILFHFIEWKVNHQEDA